MRDYKNVKVPRKYRTASARVTARRVRAAPAARRSGGQAGVLTKILMVIAIAAGCYGGWLGYKWFVESDTFQIAAVDVQGVRRLGEQDLNIFVDAFKGQNIFLVDLDLVAKRAAEHPWIKDVRIYRRLPNRISVQITERAPFALLDTGRGIYIIGEDGMVLERLSKQAESLGMPIISAHIHEALKGREIDDQAVQSSILLLKELAVRGGWRIGDVRVRSDTPESISVLYAGKEFKLGSGNYEEKFRRLSEITSDLKRRGLDFAYVDLRPERQAAVMIKK